MGNRNLSYLFLGLVIFILIGVCYLASSYFHLDRWMIRFMALLLAGVIMVSGIFFVSYLSKRRQDRLVRSGAIRLGKEMSEQEKRGELTDRPIQLGHLRELLSRLDEKVKGKEQGHGFSGTVEFFGDRAEELERFLSWLEMEEVFSDVELLAKVEELLPKLEALQDGGGFVGWWRLFGQGKGWFDFGEG